MAKISTPRTTPEEDIDRLAENLWNTYGENIEDIDSYNKYFDEYMGELTHKQDTKLRKKVFENVRERHKSVVPERLERKVGRPTKGTEILEDKRVKPKFVHLRYVKNKVVYAREDKLTYIIKEKEITRIIYRDRFGRFTSSKTLRERQKVKIHKVV